MLPSRHILRIPEDMLCRLPQATFLKRYLLARGQRPRGPCPGRFMFVRSIIRVKKKWRAYGVRRLMMNPPFNRITPPSLVNLVLERQRMRSKQNCVFRLPPAPCRSCWLASLLFQYFCTNRVSYSQLWSLEWSWRCTSGSRPKTETPC